MAQRAERKKNQRKKRTKIMIAIVVLSVLFLGAVGTVYILSGQQEQQQAAVAEKVQAEQQMHLTTTQQATQQAVRNLVMNGEYVELETLTQDAIAQIFTYAPLTTQTSLHGTAYVQADKRADYLEFLKTTLYFYYADLVKAYGETDLPQVQAIEIVETMASDFTDEATQTQLDAYEVTATWTYTENKATLDPEQRWANSGTFTWVYDEAETKWYLVQFETEYDESLNNESVGTTETE